MASNLPPNNIMEGLNNSMLSNQLDLLYKICFPNCVSRLAIHHKLYTLDQLPVIFLSSTKETEKKMTNQIMEGFCLPLFSTFAYNNTRP